MVLAGVAGWVGLEMIPSLIPAIGTWGFVGYTLRRALTAHPQPRMACPERLPRIVYGYGGGVYRRRSTIPLRECVSLPSSIAATPLTNTQW